MGNLVVLSTRCTPSPSRLCIFYTIVVGRRAGFHRIWKNIYTSRTSWNSILDNVEDRHVLWELVLDLHGIMKPSHEARGKNEASGRRSFEMNAYLSLSNSIRMMQYRIHENISVPFISVGIQIYIFIYIYINITDLRWWMRNDLNTRIKSL